MSDFVALAQTFGLPLAMTIVAVGILARALVVVSRDKDHANEERIEEIKRSAQSRIKELTEDRDWHRDRLYQALGLAENQNTTIEEVVKRVVRQLPPPGRGK